MSIILLVFGLLSLLSGRKGARATVAFQKRTFGAEVDEGFILWMNRLVGTIAIGVGLYGMLVTP